MHEGKKHAIVRANGINFVERPNSKETSDVPHIERNTSFSFFARSICPKYKKPAEDLLVVIEVSAGFLPVEWGDTCIKSSFSTSIKPSSPADQ